MPDQIKNVPQRAVQDALDQCIAAVVKRRYKDWTEDLDSRTIRSKVVKAQAAMKSLGQGELPEYNRWDALFYVTWYQPRNVNLVGSVLRQRLPDLPRRLHVVDVGCGAWAVQIALAIMIAENHPEPDSVDTVVHNVDSSRWMRAIGQELWFELWLRAKQDSALERLERVMRAMSSGCRSYASYSRYRKSLSARVARHAGSPHWCTFVHAVYHETIEELISQRESVCKEVDPVVLLVAGHRTKRDLVKRLAATAVRRVKPSSPWSGCLRRTTRLRRKILASLDFPDELTEDDKLAQNFLKGTVEWNPNGNAIEDDRVLVRGWNA